MREKIIKIINLLKVKYFSFSKKLTINTNFMSVRFGSHTTIENSGDILIAGRLIVSDYVRIINKCGIIELGNNVFLRNNVKIRVSNGRLIVGSNTTINDYTFIIGNEAGVVIGNNVRIAPFVKIFAENHVFSENEIEIHKQGMQSKGIIIGDNVWIGTNVTILDGVRIGDNVVIGAGSVIVKSIKSNLLVVGNPGRVIKEL